MIIINMIKILKEVKTYKLNIKTKKFYSQFKNHKEKD